MAEIKCFEFLDKIFFFIFILKRADLIFHKFLYYLTMFFALKVLATKFFHILNLNKYHQNKSNLLLGLYSLIKENLFLEIAI